MSNKFKSQLTEQVAKRLEMARIHSGYKSRRQFVLAHDLKLTTYRNHELGKTELSICDALFYAEKMEISASWLLFGEGSTDRYTDDLDQVDWNHLDDQHNVGNRLEISRKARGYQSRVDFSKACLIDATTIRAHETGLVKITEIRASSLVAYFFTLDVSLLWLLTGKKSPLSHHKFIEPDELAAFTLSEDVMKMQKKLEETSVSISPDRMKTPEAFRQS
jgi:hypothetical protein